MIKALIFDLGGVIVPFDFKAGYRAMQPFCPYPASEIPGRIAATGLVREYESGRLETRDFVSRLCRSLELELSFEQFAELWSSIFLPNTLIPEPWLAGLAERYPLVLLSNTNELHYSWIVERYPLLRHFHHHVLSFRAGALKPEQQIYREAIAHSGHPPGECFFTDDVEPYVEGARQAGMDAVRFIDFPSLRAELSARGVV